MKPSEMEAGRELDRLVTSRVMGWTLWPESAGGVFDRWTHPGNPNMSHHPPWSFRPSTDIADAWEVVDKLIAAGHRLFFLECAPGGFECSFTTSPRHDDSSAVAEAPTAPLAICRAALLAVGIE